MQAFLATSLSRAWVDIQNDYGPAQRTGETRGIRRTEDGDSEAFFIATRPQHLMGRQISEYRVLAHAYDLPREMKRIAETRVIR